MKRGISFILSLLLLVSSFCSFSFANEISIGGEKRFVDMPDNWATEALLSAVDNGLINGYEVANGRFEIRSNGSMTRAEMATIMNRAFGSIEKAELTGVTDVPNDKWYAEEMSKAVAMGIMKQYYVMRPNDSITRQEAFTIVARALGLACNCETHEALEGFSDRNEIADWALSSICALVQNGYISGSNGNLNPTLQISRAEFATIMDNVISNYIDEQSDISSIIVGNTVINAPEITLKNVRVEGDLIISEGIDKSEVLLENVIVTGRVIVRAGTSVLVSGESKIDNVIVLKEANIEVGKASAITTINIQVENVEISGDGTVECINVSANNASIAINDTIINVNDNVTGVTVNGEVVASGTTIKNSSNEDVSGAGAFAGGGSGGAVSGHTHNYIIAATTPSGCTFSGIQLLVCACNDEKTEIIPATHTAITVDAEVPATTTKSGLTEGLHCEACGEIIVAQEELPFIGLQTTGSAVSRVEFFASGDLYYFEIFSPDELRGEHSYNISLLDETNQWYETIGNFSYNHDGDFSFVAFIGELLKDIDATKEFCRLRIETVDRNNTIVGEYEEPFNFECVITGEAVGVSVDAISEYDGINAFAINNVKQLDNTLLYMDVLNDGTKEKANICFASRTNNGERIVTLHEDFDEVGVPIESIKSRIIFDNKIDSITMSPSYEFPMANARAIDANTVIIPSVSIDDTGSIIIQRPQNENYYTYYEVHAIINYEDVIIAKVEVDTNNINEPYIIPADVLNSKLETGDEIEDLYICYGPYMDSYSVNYKKTDYLFDYRIDSGKVYISSSALSFVDEYIFEVTLSTDSGVTWEESASAQYRPLYNPIASYGGEYWIELHSQTANCVENTAYDAVKIVAYKESSPNVKETQVINFAVPYRVNVNVDIDSPTISRATMTGNVCTIYYDNYLNGTSFFDWLKFMDSEGNTLLICGSSSEYENGSVTRNLYSTDIAEAAYSVSVRRAVRDGNGVRYAPYCEAVVIEEII